MIYQIECKNEWFLFSVSSTAKFGLVYVLTLENAFFRGFVLKPMKRAHVFLKHGTRDLQNGPPFSEIGKFLCDNRFQYFNFETDFLVNENLFQKNGVPFFS